MSSPTPEVFTPQRSNSEAAVGTGSQPDVSLAELDGKSKAESKDSALAASTSSVQSSIKAAAAGVANAIPTSSADLHAQLSEAQATIANLRTQIETASGLRQRKTDSGSGSTPQLATAERVQPAPAGGVSVQVVAGLCLLSFLLAYFLF